MIDVPKITGFRSRTINAIIDMVKSERITSVVGGKIKQTADGKTLVIGSNGIASEAKRTWGVKSISGTTLTLENCYFQWGRELKKAADLTFSLTAGNYDLWAMLSADTGSCVLSSDPTSDSDGQLFPVAIYRLNVAITSGAASVTFELNYIGSQVVIMS
jgi:hypothetical protein